jgi:hypothetical protein
MVYGVFPSTEAKSEAVTLAFPLVNPAEVIAKGQI